MYNTAYQKGYDAFMDGMTYVNCPYPSESQEYRMWLDGFYWAAADYEEKRYEE